MFRRQQNANCVPTKTKKLRQRSISLLAAPLLLPLALSASPAGAVVGDGDDDGIIDSLDLAPCNANISSMQAVPAEGQFATLLFEDQWPSQGDYDFNDLVLNYSVEVYRNAAGNVSQIRYILAPKAMGAAFDNGLAVALPVASSGVSAQLKIGNGSFSVIAAGNAGPSSVVFRVSENVRSTFFAGSTGQVNTDEARAAVNPVSAELVVTFATPVVLATAGAPFDVFLFRSGDFSHQIHLPQFAGTNEMRQDLFGSLDDGSNASKKFVDKRGVPFVLNVPASSKFAQENKRIDRLFPRIVDFAVSGGAQFSNFHEVDVDNNTSYRNSLAGPPTVAQHAPRADQTCVITVGSSAQTAGRTCRDILDQGGSRGDGVYFLDPDGTGPNAPFQARCDMTTDGGGWTMVTYAGRITNGKRATVGNSCDYLPLFDFWGTYDANSPTTQNPFSRFDLFRAVVTNDTEVMARRTSVPNNILIWPVSNRDAYFAERTQRFLPNASYLRISRTGAAGLRTTTDRVTVFNPGFLKRDNNGGYTGYGFGNVAGQNCDGCGDFNTGLSHRSMIYFESFDLACMGDGRMETQWFHATPMAMAPSASPFNSVQDVAFWMREPTASSVPLGKSAVNAGRSCKTIKDANAAATDGIYFIDPDGAGSGAPFEVFCDMTTSGGGWTLVWKHSYLESGSVAQVGAAQAQMRYFNNNTHQPCVNPANGLNINSNRWCNVPNKTAIAALGSNQMRLMASNNATVIYDYFGAVGGGGFNLDTDSRGAFLGNTFTKIKDVCTTANTIPPEPVTDTSFGIPGLTFDKFNYGVSTGNCDTDRYNSTSQHDCRWENCQANIVHTQQTLHMFVR